MSPLIVEKLKGYNLIFYLTCLYLIRFQTSVLVLFLCFLKYI